jgi:signal transduction histidine kinase
VGTVLDSRVLAGSLSLLMRLRARWSTAAVVAATGIALVAALVVHQRASEALVASARLAGALSEAHASLLPAAWAQVLSLEQRGPPVLDASLIEQLTARWASLDSAAPSLRETRVVQVREGLELARAQSVLRAEREARRLRDAQGFGAASVAFGMLVLWAGRWTLRRSRVPSPALAANPSPSEGELEKFAARVAHDVLSPLQAVSSALEIVGRTQDPARLKRCEQAGKSSLKRVQRVVEGLVEYARADVAPQPNDHALVPEVLNEVLADLRERADDEQVELRVRDEAPAMAAMDPRALNTVLHHLVRNAIQYMPDRPERWVEVRIREHGGRVRIDVADSAGGIPVEQRERLFDAYVRPKGLKKSGLGLGLATVKRMVEAHGGNLRVESEPGAGTTFVVELPTATPALTPTDRPTYLT